MCVHTMKILPVARYVRLHSGAGARYAQLRAYLASQITKSSFGPRCESRGVSARHFTLRVQGLGNAHEHGTSRCRNGVSGSNVQGHPTHEKTHPPLGPPRPLGIGLL